ncbi:MAG: hydroxyethylthiazole kinase [Bacteroidales bacterium]|nr:hydroxyethylthiazole kinase [Bacteroidales bacterium]
MFNTGDFRIACDCIKERRPLVVNVTNYVAMTPSANALLAIGASPIMVVEPSEVEEIVEKSAALVLNIGCLESTQIEVMKLAAARANELDIPWVLDPAGVGMSWLRTDTALQLIRKFKPAVIRANASEIAALASVLLDAHELKAMQEVGFVSNGVDSSMDSKSALEYAKNLAKFTGSIVSLSGEVDYIIDGVKIVSLSNGSPLMPRVTAMGCIASAVTAAFLSVACYSEETGCTDYLQAAVDAMALMGVAGDKAHELCDRSSTAGTGSFFVNFLDVLSGFDATELAGRVKAGVVNK